MAHIKIAETLPNRLPGAVCEQWRERDGKRYGPYYCRCWREGGRLHKQYVKRDDVDAVRAACQRHREEQQARRRKHADLMQRLREYKATCREVEQWMKRARWSP